MDRATAAGILVSIPFVGVLVLVELLASRRLGRDYYAKPLDVAAGFTSGMWNLTIAGTGLVFTFVSYEIMEEHLHVVRLGSTVLAAVVAFVVLDFTYYWFHRAAHRYNFLWQTHLVHHSGEHLNVAAAVRNGGVPISFRFLMLIPVALLGVSAPIVLIMGGVQLVGGIWYHTRFFKEMGPLGKVFVTPGFHRVHHGMNDIYIDRNFSALLSIWDRLFGTYQAEVPDEPLVVGITRPVRTYNPLRMDYTHWWQMVKDTARTSSARDKAKVWFSRTNWRPADVVDSDPVPELVGEELDAYEPYAPYADRVGVVWSYLEVAVQALLTAGLFWGVYSGRLSYPDVVLYAGFLLLSIVTYTTAMDGRPHLHLALARLVATGALAVSVAGADWFGLGTVVSPLPATLLVFAFFAGAVVMGAVARRAPAPPLPARQPAAAR